MPTAGSLTPADMAVYREYHARRRRDLFDQREAARLKCLRAAREGIRLLAPRFAGIRAAYLFGSVLEAGRFTDDSDVDVAVDSDDVRDESRFRLALEEHLERDVDLRSNEGRIARTVETLGECVYEREVSAPGA